MTPLDIVEWLFYAGTSAEIYIRNDLRLKAVEIFTFG